MLRVDEGHRSARRLGLGDDLERERRLAARFGAVDLDDATARNAADAERCIEGKRSRGDDAYLEVVTAIAKKQPYYAVFRDSSMADDSTATNFDQIFETYSPSTVRKVL